MGYCTRDDLDESFGVQEVAELLDRDNSGNEDLAALQTAIENCAAIADGYLAGRYATPIPAPTPQILVAITCDLVRFRLWGNGAPQIVTDRNRDAIRMLRDIATGVISLPGATAASSSTGGYEYAETSRAFTADTLADF